MFLRSISYSLGKFASPSILNKSFAKRSITFMIDIDDVKGHGFNELIQMSEEMGCDEHIHMRKEAVKRKMWRYNLKKGKAGRNAKTKVYALLDVIEFKRANKYR